MAGVFDRRVEVEFGEALEHETEAAVVARVCVASHPVPAGRGVGTRRYLKNTSVVRGAEPDFDLPAPASAAASTKVWFDAASTPDEHIRFVDLAGRRSVTSKRQARQSANAFSPVRWT